MDEDDEIRSPPSPESEPHSPPSGQITVTVAAAPPSNTPSSTPTPPQSNLTLALPIQQFPRPLAIVSSGGGGGGREDCWSEGATSVLIDAWGERYMELSRGNLKQKHWEEVADIVSSREDYAKLPKTHIQCKNRIDTVKKKYKIEKQKVAEGCGPSRWPFYERLDRLIGPSATPTITTAVRESGAGLRHLSTATVSTGGQPSHGKAVPVGIPVGVRPSSLPFSSHYLQTPPHLQPQQLHHQQQPHYQQLRQNFQFSPPLRYNNNNNNNNNNINSNNSINNAASAMPMPVNRVSFEQQLLKQKQNHHQQQQQQFRRAPPVSETTDSDPEEWSHDSGDSLPPERTGFGQRKRARMSSGPVIGVRGKGKGKRRDKKAAVKVWGNSVRELTKAIMKFGEAYETAESAKLQHIVEMEMQRMKFAKELELQRMKFMMKTQLELSQLNGNGSNNSDSRGGGVGGGENNHNLHENHANSDSSN